MTACVSLSVLCQPAHIFYVCGAACTHDCVREHLKDSTIWGCEGGGGGADGDAKGTDRGGTRKGGEKEQGGQEARTGLNAGE